MLGVGWGIGILLTPTLLPVLLMLLSFAVLPRLMGGRQLRLRDAAATLAGAMIVFMPYSVERSMRVGAPLIVRSNFGLELFLSNNSASHPRFLDNMADSMVMARYHPLLRRREALRVAKMGEGPYHTMLRREATAWIVAHPGSFARLTLGRIKEFWLPKSNFVVKTAFLWGLTIVGMGWMVWHATRRTDRHAMLARLWLAAILANSGVYYLIQGDIRYRYPIHGLLLLAASAATMELFERTRRRRPVAG